MLLLQALNIQTNHLILVARVSVQNNATTANW